MGRLGWWTARHVSERGFHEINVRAAETEREELSYCPRLSCGGARRRCVGGGCRKPSENSDFMGVKGGLAALAIETKIMTLLRQKDLTEKWISDVIVFTGDGFEGVPQRGLHCHGRQHVHRVGAEGHVFLAPIIR